MNQLHPATANRSLDDNDKDQSLSSPLKPVSQRGSTSQARSDGNISSEDLQTPVRPQAEQTSSSSDNYLQSRLQSIKGTAQEALGVLIQDGDLESQGEQTKIDADKQLHHQEQGK